MEECVFCKIAKGEIPAKKVYENSHTFAFLDINPRNKGHTLVIPKKHYLSLTDMPDDEAAEVIKTVRHVAVAQRDSLKTLGMSLLQSNGRMAGQMVPHVHFHLIPRTEEERGLGLESVLPVKKLEDAELDSIAKQITKALPKEQKKEHETLHREEVEEAKPAAHAEEPAKEKPRVKKRHEDINFDF